ncbi:glycosyltransferase family 4 protein [Aquisalibacillus elongatus]|uniref:Glycosyltransferase involved in cell wall biosynthesis n=1 Tax=Aquisalibacillus elongatus TaxID=485577 RepID=A0A3N5BA01_9BACI|nr:glycosyltransferase family 4 protein [Aquisalibacillus elongatus]RPF54207.1 glycosyltransferase involved in cell wall biosynthesis [Aquisalibacillus elongatus]
MKVCHLTSVHQYNDIRISIKECKSLVDSGYNVTLIAPNTKETDFQGIKVHGLTNFSKSKVKRIRNFTKKVFQAAINVDADIYHFHDPELIPVGLKLKRRGKKVVYDVHEDVPRQILTKYWIPKLLRRLLSVIFEKYENKSSKKFDALVTATPFIDNRFDKIGCKTINVNNYPKLNELHSPSSELPKDIAVSYIGGITKSRGIEIIVSGMENVKGSLFLAGNFSNNQLYESISNYNGWSNVNYLGQIDRNKVKEVLSKSVAGLVLFDPSPNHINAQPNKMFEYMSAGIPVIASNFPLWKEIIEENNCGICVDPLNVNQVAEAIQWVTDNPTQAKQMGMNGREAIEKYYNWEQESEKLLDLYNNL